MKKNIIIAAVLIIAGAAGAYLYLNISRSSKSTTVSNVGDAFCRVHQIAEKDCPWCDASLITKLGMCPGHGVPEALCSRCNAALIPGFKAEGDWCAGHGLPESQCAACREGQLPSKEISCDKKETGL